MPILAWWPSIAVSALCIFSAFAAVIATPVFNNKTTPPLLESVVPMQLGEWVNKPSPYAQVSVNTFAQEISDAIYDQVLMRTYQDPVGNQVMLALAFAGQQRQEIKIHQPEVCYPAQGYQMLAIGPHLFNMHGYQPIPGKQLLFKSKNRLEAVSYWIRVGDTYPATGFEMRMNILKAGLDGKLLDGVLVRVSSVIDDEAAAQEAYKMHEKFLNELVHGVDLNNQGILLSAIK